MRKAVWLLEAALFILLSIPLAILPYRISIKVGELLGILLFHLWRGRRKIAIENLKRSVLAGGIAISDLPEKIIRNNFKNLGRSFVELIKVYYGIDRRIFDSVHFEGIENVNAAESMGRGILFLTGHCGNWELMAVVLSARLKSVAVVARPINNPFINGIVERVRKRCGNRVIYKQGALKSIIQTLRNNGAVGILMDQAVLSDEGYVIDFLGRDAWTTKMPALIARKTGVPVIPIFIHRINGGHRIKIHPPLELSENGNREHAAREDTKRFSSFIEEYIRNHPTEWLWIHRKWKRVNTS
ncbi:MAG: lysophospholipid acyltransferase family protein [Nitrospirota bacterium]